MSYFNCRQGGHHTDCNGYVGPLDTYVCHCPCHEHETAPPVPAGRPVAHPAEE